MNARTTNIIAQNEDYFIADLDNGGVRIGQLGFAAFDFPADHAEYSKVKSLDISQADAAFDEYFAKYLPISA